VLLFHQGAAETRRFVLFFTNQHYEYQKVDYNLNPPHANVKDIYAARHLHLQLAAISPKNRIHRKVNPWKVK
jgi:hypothetical protein